MSVQDDLILVGKQCLVIILVLGRWMLPKGHMSRERLSDMLLAYVGMAADILDFITEAIEDTKVKCSEDRTLLAIVLIVYSLSLFQFALGLNMFIL